MPMLTVGGNRTVGRAQKGAPGTPPPSGDEPTPDDVGATILYDIRASLDACTTRAQMAALIDDLDAGIDETELNIYNDGTHVWMRYNWATGGPDATEVAFSGVIPWSGINTGVVDFCVTWTEQWGKMSGDTGGQGTNDTLAFRTDYVNAHLKTMLVLRGQSGQSVDRRMYVKAYPNNTDVQIDANNYNSAEFGYDVFDGQGIPVRWTMRVNSSSSDGADDGTLEMWRNGTKVADFTAQALGRGGVWGLNTLATFISTTGPTTGYQRAIAIWGI